MLKLYDFMTGGFDHAGRTHAYVCEQSDDWIESTHDFIQWLFPLEEETRKSELMPILSKQEIGLIKKSELAQNSLRISANRMRRFWSKNQHWVTNHDHNHLRITRCIKSLRLLVSNEEAELMKIWLSSVLGPNAKLISKVSLDYWREA